MESEEVVDLLRHYRHDLMNHLQIIKGYHDMNNSTKVNVKLNELIELLDKERKLTNLNIPKFFIWVLQFNTIHQHLRMSYDIQAESNQSLTMVENELISQCEAVTQMINKWVDDTALYELELILKDSDEGLEMVLIIHGSFKNDDQFLMELTNIGNAIATKDATNQSYIFKTDFSKVKG